ncbi:spore germination protein [Sporosarcina sp. ACRSM]|uniref:GerAB/ArcD/ProY family transporter n=1 Tax=Sporosarcina sp. ACRSM TaxID=2918216 RepID=UPI001EF5371F|nr:GerAB/ArcD/ProY family transporter [Sporosarcina sp. ACRSM]MCG7335908.1 spore germination protein [Sporosarcina sp. ACRSM]
MHIHQSKTLNGYHVVFLVQNVMIGSALLSLPNLLSPVGYSQWWFPIMFGAFANLLLIPMIWIARQNHELTLFGIHQKLFGKWVGTCINTAIIVYAIILLASVCEGYLELIQVVALSDRTITGPLFIFFLLLIYIANNGIKSIARFCIASFFLVTWLLYFLTWGFTEGDIGHTLPLFNFTREEFLAATQKGFISVVGFEVILFYFPYIIQQEKAFRHASYGIWICILCYLSTTLVSVMYYSQWQLENVMYPVLYLFNAVKLSFLERIDVLAITLWVFFILTTTAAYLWVAKKGVDSIRGMEKKSHLYIIALIIYLMISLPLPKEFQKELYERIYYVTYGLMIWPIFLCVVQFVKNKKEGIQ